MHVSMCTSIGMYRRHHVPCLNKRTDGQSYVNIIVHKGHNIDNATHLGVAKAATTTGLLCSLL